MKKNNYEENQMAEKTLSVPVREKAQQLVDTIIKKLPKKLKNLKGDLNNIVFFWGDDACDLVYINNVGLNGKTGDELKKYIRDEDSGWLNGEMIEVDLIAVMRDVSMTFLEEQLPQRGFDALGVLMEEVCRILIKNRPSMANIKMSEDFIALTVFHDN
jgi:hypothetical protein